MSEQTKTDYSNEFIVPEAIQALQPYRAGKPINEVARDHGLNPEAIIKLASNENPLGFSPKVTQALVDYLSHNAASHQGRYPDPNGFELKGVLSEYYGVAPDGLTLGNGSNELLEIISLAFLSPGCSAVYSAHSFMVYRLSTQARGARGIEVPAKDLGLDLDAMFEAIEPTTRVVYVANPNNPTGTFLQAQAIESFVQRVYERYGKGVLVVLDEAYTEYLEPSLRPNSLSLIEAYPNVVVLRTFSKAYGLAGLRVGFAAADPQVTDYLNRVRQPFNVNQLAQLAATVALKDEGFLQQSYESNREGKQYLSQAFERMGIPYMPSFTNFILFEQPRAAEVAQALLAKGVIVRPVAGDGLPNHLRVSIGTASENEAFVTALSEVLQAMGLAD